MAALSVFLSYAHEDVSHARKLYAVLKSAGFEPWIDEESLLPGQDWELEIKRALNKSDFCILCLSKVAIAKRGFLQKEIKRVLDTFEEFPDGSIYLIPARLDACEIPPSVSRQQWVDLFEPNGMSKLLKALQYEVTRRANKSTRLGPAVVPVSEMGVSITRGTKDRITRLQSAATRLNPYFRAIAEGRHKLVMTMGVLRELPARWRGRVPETELLRRLESMQRIVNGSIAVTNHATQIVQFISYADPRIGVGPGNVNEALAAYQVTKRAPFTDAIRCASELRQSVQRQTWLAEFAPATLQALDQIRGQIHSLQTEISRLGEI